MKSLFLIFLISTVLSDPNKRNLTSDEYIAELILEKSETNDENISELNPGNFEIKYENITELNPENFETKDENITVLNPEKSETKNENITELNPEKSEMKDENITELNPEKSEAVEETTNSSEVGYKILDGTNINIDCEEGKMCFSLLGELECPTGYEIDASGYCIEKSPNKHDKDDSEEGVTEVA